MAPSKRGGGPGIFASDVDPPVGRPGGQSGNGHRLDDRERVVLAHDPVLEGAGLGLVAIGHNVLVGTGFIGHGSPFDPGGEGGTTPP